MHTNIQIFKSNLVKFSAIMRKEYLDMDMSIQNLLLKHMSVSQHVEKRLKFSLNIQHKDVALNM